MADYRYIKDKRTGTTHRLLGVVDDTLTEEGIAADAKVVGDALATKAEVDGAYDSMTVGNAEQLISSVYEEDSVPYTFRTSGGSLDIGDREEDTIIGGTVAWNQLQAKKSTPSTLYGLTVSATAENGAVTLTGTKNATYRGLLLSFYNAVKNHKYLMLLNNLVVGASNTGTVCALKHYTQVNSASVFMSIGGAIINNDVDTTDLHFGTGVNDANAVYNLSFVPQLFDLTQLFGSTIADYIYTLEQTTAGAGVAWFRKLFPKPYYAYNLGELLSVSDLQSHDMVGFNAFNGEVLVRKRWYNGTFIDATDGVYAASSYLVKCLPNTTYCISLPNETAQIAMYLNEFDADQTWIRANAFLEIPSNTKYATFTTNSDAYYIAFSFYRSTSMTAAEFENMNVNLHWDGERDGEYEPYKKWSYPLDDSLTLRGIPKLDSANELYYDGDVYESDGTVTRRYGVINLVGGNEATYQQNGTSEITSRALVTISGKANGLYNFFSNRFWTQSIADYVGKMSGRETSNKIEFHLPLSVPQTADGIKAWFAANPTQLVYELAEPTTESADPYQEVQIVDDFGTEEYVTTSIVPVGHETKYQPNLRAKLEMAPNSPDGNGDYIVRHTNGENVYVPLAFPADELPPAPTEDGTYSMTVTVSNGTPSYAWVSV